VTDITQPEIIERLGGLSITHKKLSRQTISEHLKKLKKEGKISQKGRKYFPLNDDAVNMNIFSASINAKLRGILLSDEPINMISNKFYPGRIRTHDLSAKYIYEFANLLGASIIYLLIENMRPEEVSLKYREDMNIVEHLIKNSLPMDELVIKFRDRLGIDTRRTKYGTASLDLNNQNFIRLSREFRKVYPQLYRELEDGWQSMTRLILTPRNNKKQISCDHQWHKRYLYRHVEYYECRNCYLRKTTKSK
jgi:DNA-binding transcriptional ArsR family regulator